MIPLNQVHLKLFSYKTLTKIVLLLRQFSQLPTHVFVSFVINEERTVIFDILKS